MQETYAIEDCHIYITDYNVIKQNWTKYTDVSGRTIYINPTNYQSDVELSCKYKTTRPSAFLIGFGDKISNYYAKCMYYRDGTKLGLFKDNGWVAISNPSTDVNTVFKLRTSNLHAITPYLDNTAYTTQNTSSSHPLYLRIDDFTSSPSDFEFVKVKAL